MNFNDAEITSLYVSENGIQDDAPNATSGGPFNVVLEMVAGAGLTGPYTVSITCSDLSLTAPAPAVLIPTGLNLSGNFGSGPGWTGAGPLANVFNQSGPAGPEPAGDKGHVYQYTASLFTSNGQIVSIKQSDPFVLL
jgi:hypothetical protein